VLFRDLAAIGRGACADAGGFTAGLVVEAVLCGAKKDRDGVGVSQDAVAARVVRGETREVGVSYGVAWVVRSSPAIGGDGGGGSYVGNRQGCRRTTYWNDGGEDRS
jgi:hypothetical protein